MKKHVLTVLKIILIPVFILGLVVLHQYHFDRDGFEQLKSGKKIKYIRIDDGVHLLPSPEGLKILANGFDAFLSRFLMIQASNYFYQFKHSGRDRGYMNRLYSGATALDRYYFLAYRYGGYFLSGPFKMQTDALRSLKRGVMELVKPDLKLSPFYMNSDDPKTKLLRKEKEPREQASKLMLETAITYFAYLKDNIAAAGVLKCAQFVFPEFRNDFFETELSIREEENQFHMVIAMWENFKEQNRDDEHKVKLGEYKINLYTSLLRKDMYEKQAALIKEKTGNFPDALFKFVRPEEVVDEFGDMYMYYPETGKLYCRTHLNDDVQTERNALEKAVQRFRKINDVLPVSLSQVEEFKKKYNVIDAPLVFKYNVVTGEVGLPRGFDGGIEAFLQKTAAAGFIHAVKTGTFKKEGDPLELFSLTGDASPEAMLENLHEYSFRFLTGGIPFAIAAEKKGVGVYILSGDGVVRFKSGVTGVTAWPSSLDDWEVMAF